MSTSTGTLRTPLWRPRSKPCPRCKTGAMAASDVETHPVNGRRYVEYVCHSTGCRGYSEIEFEPEHERLPAAAEFDRPADGRKVRDRAGDTVEIPVEQGRLPT